MNSCQMSGKGPLSPNHRCYLSGLCKRSHEQLVWRSVPYYQRTHGRPQLPKQQRRSEGPGFATSHAGETSVQILPKNAQLPDGLNKYNHFLWPFTQGEHWLNYIRKTPLPFMWLSLAYLAIKVPILKKKAYAIIIPAACSNGIHADVNQVSWWGPNCVLQLVRESTPIYSKHTYRVLLDATGSWCLQKSLNQCNQRGYAPHHAEAFWEYRHTPSCAFLHCCLVLICHNSNQKSI